MGQYENGGSSRRNTNWCLIGYTESLILMWEDLLSRDVADYYISPLHDKDVFTKDESHKDVNGVIVEHKKGEKKKPHYHVCVKFDSLKSWEQVREWADGFGFAMIQSCMSWSGALRYLCHLDGGTGKALYNVKDVKCLNDDYLTVINKATDKAVITKQIISYIKDKKVKEFCNLVAYACEQGSDWLNEVRQYAFFYKSICQSIKAVSCAPVRVDSPSVKTAVNSASSDYSDDVPF